MRGETGTESVLLGRRIAERRKQLGLSQESLAARLGVSRQFIGAVESGRSLPSVRVAVDLAKALGTTVEALFDTAQEENVHWGDPSFDATPGVRVRFARLDGQLIAYPLKKWEAMVPADGVVDHAGRPEPLLPETFEAAERTVAIAGCDPALNVLREWVSENGTPVRVLTFPWGSEPAVRALAEGRVHLAGVHGSGFSPPDTDKDMLFSDKTKSGAPGALVRIHFARWEVGIAVAPGNPKGVAGLEDLVRPDVLWVRRPAGTAIERLYHQMLSQCPGKVHWCPMVADSHVRVAEMIASGMADAGLTTSFAAHLFNLSFIPVEEHSFDLLVPFHRLADQAISTLADLLRTATFRRQMESLWGYDVSRLGDVANS
jgi:putative molybdopterin biosynthesis protein